MGKGSEKMAGGSSTNIMGLVTSKHVLSWNCRSHETVEKLKRRKNITLQKAGNYCLNNLEGEVV